MSPTTPCLGSSLDSSVQENRQGLKLSLPACSGESIILPFSGSTMLIYRTIWFILLLMFIHAIASCMMMVPKKCPEDHQVEVINTDLGPVYICAKKNP